MFYAQGSRILNSLLGKLMQKIVTKSNVRYYKNLWPMVICSLASFFYFYDYFVQVAPSIMTHQLMASFSIDAAGLGILSAGFFYSYTLMQIPAGMLLDRFGARKLLTFAVFISACGIIWFSTTYNFTAAILSRSVVGFGSAFSFVSALFLLSRWFKHRYFALLAGLVQFFGCVGAIFGLGPLAVVVNHSGWRHALMYMGIFTLILGIIFWLVIRDGQSLHIEGDPAPASILQRIKSLLTRSQVWWVIICGFISWMPVAAVGGLWGVPYLMKTYGLTNTTAGNICSLFWLGLGIGSPIIGWLSDRILSRQKPLVFCFSCALLASILLIQAVNLTLWITGLALFMLGLSSSVQSLSFALLKDITPAKQFGTVSGINNMSAIFGGAVSQIAIGFILTSLWSGKIVNHVPVYSIDEYRLSLLLLPCAALIGILISRLKIRETRCRHCEELCSEAIQEC